MYIQYNDTSIFMDFYMCTFNTKLVMILVSYTSTYMYFIGANVIQSYVMFLLTYTSTYMDFSFAFIHGSLAFRIFLLI